LLASFCQNEVNTARRGMREEGQKDTKTEGLKKKERAGVGEEMCFISMDAFIHPCDDVRHEPGVQEHNVNSLYL
jgi:hypothetical protein